MKIEAGAAWHVLTGDEVLARLDARAEGLTADEAARRLGQYGPNALQATAPVSVLRILVDQLASIVVALLFVAALVALVMGDRLEAIAILAVLVINTTLGFVVELRARRAMEALLGLDVPHATVVRDGRPVEIDARDLVPGDVILIEAGQAVPADARLLDAAELRIDEAPLTGESVPVDKDAAAGLDEATPVADRVNLIYKATTVVAGTGRAMVTATGAATEVGRIGALAGSIGEERTPLEEKLAVLGHRLVWLTLAIAVIVVIAGILRGFPLLAMLEAAIALAIAAVPEGLPAVATVTLGLGLRRMARRNALIRRLPAVEALGSATTICTDKTGTLTAGQMAVKRLVLPDLDVHVTGEGYAPEGEFRVDDRTIEPHDHDALIVALRIGVLVNRARVELEDGRWVPYGDPTEAALLVAGAKAGLARDALLRDYPERGAVPFSSERRWMATMHGVPDGSVHTFVKGDPTGILERSRFMRTADGEAALTDAVRSRLGESNRSLAASGLRVLGLAYTTGEDASGNLVFAGLAGMIDPPVQGVKDTIARFHDAGIRTVMITGDQRATAESIARELGVLRAGDRTLDGRELHAMGDADLAAAVGAVGAFSRVSPEDKLRIVAALQERGEIVAMLGDGVNDAAALKKAAIGVAMGLRGTDVAREASDVVLTDDRFESVGAAIEEGRVIYDNIRKFVFYLFSCNLAEVLVLMLGLLAGLPLPLLPLQILWLNLVTDTFPALALALEPADPDVMKRRPRDPAAALLSRRFLLRILQSAGILTASTLAAFVWGLQSDPDRAVTLCFMTLALGQILHLGNARSRGAVLEPGRALANRWALAAVALSMGLQLLTVLLPGLRTILHIVVPTATEWLVIAVCSAAPAVIGQLLKLLRSRRLSRS